MSFKARIQQNARVITLLHERIHETFKHRDDNASSRAVWENACAEFHKGYQELAFPGGTTNVRERLRAGDVEAIEYAIDFLEIRPYFFRSGYMYKDFMRVLKNCPLTLSQRIRFEAIRERYEQYRKTRSSSRSRSVN